MLMRFGFEITADCPGPVPLLLALSVHTSVTGRIIGQDVVRTDPVTPAREYIDQFGNRITRMVAPGGRLHLWSDAVIEMSREPDPVDWSAVQHPVDELPDDTLRYLVASRYCDSDTLSNFAWNRFGHIEGGWARVQAICDHVHEETSFGYKFGRSDKTASEVQREKTGVCRDFAHFSVTLCRAMNIPARYASGYLPDIDVPYAGPGDFCAWFEAYIGGRWHTFDARHNTPRIGRVLMVHGEDAADVAIATSYGGYQLNFFKVWSDEIPDAPDHEVQQMLETRPDTEALVFPSSGRW